MNSLTGLSAPGSRPHWKTRLFDATIRRLNWASTGETKDMAEETIVVTPAANPAAVGLVAFGLTTVLLSLVNAGVLPPGGEPVVIPLALAFGGLMQFFAGAFEFKLGNTFGMTAFLSYGAFWWWFAFLLLFAQNHRHFRGRTDGRHRAPAVGRADPVFVDQHLPSAEDPVPGLSYPVVDLR